MWVTEPQDVCSLPGVSDPAACGSAPLFRIAGLTCDQGQAHATDWSLEGEFYVEHPGIVPDGLYFLHGVRAIRADARRFPE